MLALKKNFSDRKELIEYVKTIAPWANGNAAEISGGHYQAQKTLQKIDPANYAKTRNFCDGKVSMLSPFINHGLISINEVRNYVLKLGLENKFVKKFIQELAWRDFWQRLALQHPEWLWNDVENYKTGFNAADYHDIMPQDIINANTGVACIDQLITTLYETGYLHNHARMYVASYVVHFRRLRWQVGAIWFLEHLLDGDEASNNFSWQWIASTFSNKPYIFNLENIKKYFSKSVDTSFVNNKILDNSYAKLREILFPNLTKDYDK